MKALVVAGVMSGTSADGVDVALVRITPTTSPESPKLKLLGHHSVPYSAKLRAAVLAAMDAKNISAAELARLHWRLGEVYGDAVVDAQRAIGKKAQLVGVHGQTIFHQGQAQNYLGSPLRCTWQIGEASAVAAKAGLPVVSDFRPSDMTAGGQGAPLVPVFDRVVFAHAKRNRVLQNLGGIANMTAMPANSEETLAFDSGPSNVLIDLCTQSLFGKRYDRGGLLARKGKVLPKTLAALLCGPYFNDAPPKSCGREQFGEAYAKQLMQLARKERGDKYDMLATATALTAESILAAYRNFVWPFLGQRAPLADGTDYIVAGGGAKNSTLMQMLRDGLEPLGLAVSATEAHGVPTQAKEAMAFALLAWLRWNHLPGNVPSATGAKRSVSLGRVTLA